jgi:hypothetical protein
VAYFKILYQYLPVGTEEKHETSYSRQSVFWWRIERGACQVGNRSANRKKKVNFQLPVRDLLNISYVKKNNEAY